MDRRWTTITVFLTLLLLSCSKSPTSMKDKPDYLGQDSPPAVPERFAPGTVSIPGTAEYGGHFSPDGKEFIFTRYGSGHRARLYSTRWSKKGWSPPEPLPFMETHRGGESCFTPNGKSLIYVCISDDSDPVEHDLYVAERSGSGWKIPHPLTSTELGERRIAPSISSNLNLYFSGNLGKPGDKDIYISRYIEGEYRIPENLGPNVNSGEYEEHVFISPDERLLLFDSERPGGSRRGDIYASFRGPDGTWRKAFNLGPPVNTEAWDWFPVITPDRKALIFARTGEGEIDIYWCSVESIDSLRTHFRE